MDIKILYGYIDKYIHTYKKFINGANEICIRCPYCGDSEKHKNKGHLYIGQSDGIFLYQCKRSNCNASGILTQRLLETLGIIDINLFSLIRKNNIRSIKKVTNIASYTNNFDNYNFNLFKNISQYKLNYLYSRLFNINDIDLDKYRIILSPSNFIETYNILLNEFQLSLLTELERNSIGFLDMTGSSIIFRFIKEYNGYRYYKLKLDKDKMSIYSIKSKINLMNAEKLNINICEGPFDIINIYNRLDSIIDKRNDIFISALGKDFINKIEYVSKFIGLANIHINFFRDSDMKPAIIHKNMNYSLFKDSYSIYSNSLGKDYSEENLFLIKDF